MSRTVTTSLSVAQMFPVPFGPWRLSLDRWNQERSPQHVPTATLCVDWCGRRRERCLRCESFVGSVSTSDVLLAMEAARRSSVSRSAAEAPALDAIVVYIASRLAA